MLFVVKKSHFSYQAQNFSFLAFRKSTEIFYFMNKKRFLSPEITLWITFYIQTFDDKYELAKLTRLNCTDQNQTT